MSQGEDLMKLLGNVVVDEAVRTWNNQYPKGVWPEALVQEMHVYILFFLLVLSFL